MLSLGRLSSSSFQHNLPGWGPRWGNERSCTWTRPTMKTEGPRWTGDWGPGWAMVVSRLAAAGQQDLASSRTRRRAPSSASETANSLRPQSMETVASCGGEIIAKDARTTPRCAPWLHRGKQLFRAQPPADGIDVPWMQPLHLFLGPATAAKGAVLSQL